MSKLVKKLLQYGITSVVGLGIALLILVYYDTFHQTDLKTIYGNLSDAFFVPGGITLGFGVLVFASNEGTFDMLKFGFIKLFTLFKRDMTKVKYRTFYDYHEAMKDRVHSFVYFLIVGAVLTLVAVVFLILYSNTPDGQTATAMLLG